MRERRKWLIISYFSGVDGLACSHHLDDRLVELRKLGVEPVVVSGLCSPPGSDYPKLRAVSLAPSGLRYEIRYIARRSIRHATVRRLAQLPFMLGILPGYALEKLVLNLDSTWSWFVTASMAAARAGRRSGAEVIYSTGGPWSAHVAAYLCARITGLPWIAEYQDPVAGHDIPRSRAEKLLHPRIERLVASRADALVFLTRTAAQEAEKRAPVGARGHYVYPGATEALFGRTPRSPGTRATFTIGHFGSLSGERTVQPVLDALAQLVQSEPGAQGRVRILLAGDMGSAQQATLKAFAYPSMLDYRSKVSRDAALAMMAECDLLLVIQDSAAYSTVTIPSKAYEYMASGVPVLGLTHANEELGAMLRELGHLACDLRDQPAVLRHLEETYRRWRAGTAGTERILPSPYTTESAARELLVVADAARPRTHCRSGGSLI